MRASDPGRRVLRALLAMLVLLAVLCGMPGARAQGAASAQFDHARTGFVLDGLHARARCESCHLNGVMRGTPRDCASCHTSGSPWARGNIVKPPTHLPTTAPCDSCHLTRGFAGARFSHVGVSGVCATCHNGRTATGKPASHMVTTASCDACHRSSGWMPASGFDHSGVQPGSCASCHNGSRAKGRPANHVPYATVAAIGNAACDACHKGSFASFVPAAVHANFSVTAQCASCHTGSFGGAVGKPATAVHATATTCENCHNPMGWTTVSVDHQKFTSTTNCAVCHNGSTAAGKPSSHVPVGNTNCVACHAKGGPGWKPASYWNHTQLPVAGQCTACHTGSYPPADGKVANHIPYAAVPGIGNPSCDSCHKSGYQSWAPGYLHANFSVTVQCASCHTGSFQSAVGKPANALHANASACESCHRTGSWRGATVNHAPFGAATDCASCHNGTAAAGKSPTHMPVGSTNCVNCHNKDGPGWRPATYWNHTQVTVAGQCATCHTGGFAPADGRPANHVPYASVGGLGNVSCDTCHRSGHRSWAPGYFHANVPVTTQCATCHTGSFQAAVGKPNTPVHATATACESCHRTTGWTNVSVDHSRFTAATNCGTCHNGTTATGRAANHIPVGATNCIACHAKAPSTWKPSLWTHTQMAVAGQCATCHNGSFPPADGRPGNHIAYAAVAGVGNASCDACHKSGYVAWAPGYFHANFTVATQCATCHTGSALGAVGKPGTAIHAGVTACEQCHKPGSWRGATVDHAPFNASTNCASCHNGSAAAGKSALHIPVGTTNCVACHAKAPMPWKPAIAWNHTQVPVSGQCASCHSGGFPPADGRAGNHIPYERVGAAAAASCDSCHRSGFIAWAPGLFHRNVSVSTQCAVCHTGTYQNAVGKPATAVHASVTSCEGCHQPGSWTAARVDHAPFTAATNCTNCHNGSTASGKPATHVPVGVTNCIACHAKSPTPWRPSSWNHGQLAVAGQCATCHSGAYPPADGKVSNHIPYASVGVSAAANCDACHKGGYASWATGRFHAYFTVTVQCATCHTGNFLSAVGKPATAIHAGVTACESCHKTSGWLGAAVDHSTYTAATNCASCHNGSTASGKPGSHVPVGSTNCAACHNKAPNTWKPSTWNHTQLSVAGQCGSCHTGGFQPADGRPANHIPYTSVAAAANASCDSCHRSGYNAWAPGYFHANYTVGTQCATCHTGGFLAAVGKPATAIHAGVTACESCHGTGSWLGAKVDHTPFGASTDCASCHNGTTATGKSARHIPVGTTNCIACHAKAPTPWKPSTAWNHTQVAVAGRCATCHNGSYPPADGRVANHIPYGSVAASASASCENCHRSGYIAWAPGYFHANFTVTAQCATCHTGGFLAAVGKPNTAIHAGVTQCEGCHKPGSWLNAKVDHSGYTAATNCASCHNGTTATGKTATHIPIGAANCIACHNKAPGTWKPSLWNHTQLPVAAQCASCHTGGFPPADGRVPNHIPYASVSASASANCDTCHRAGYVAWAPGVFHANVSVTAQCATCHTGTYLNAVGKPATAIHAGVTSCEGCHQPTGWLGARVDHSTYTSATNCASCHNGTTASGKPAKHIPVGSTNCISCHNKSPNTWKPSLWNHTQLPVAGQCASCHTGGFQPADGKPVNHVPYTSVAAAAAANCDACHKAGYATWRPGVFHANFTVTTGCATCHTGSFLGAVGKTNTTIHATATVCESCHKSTSNWLSINYTHVPANAVGTGTCDTCHNGTTAKGKTGTHIPVTTGPTKCDSCHKSQQSFALQITMNHTVVSATTCKTCHNGSYVAAKALAKPANHIPEATQLLNGGSMDCNACHTSTTLWSSQRMNHNSSLGNGAGWCKGCHERSTSYLGGMFRMALNHRNLSKPPTDCSMSGCHRPLGNFGAAYTKWN